MTTTYYVAIEHDSDLPLADHKVSLHLTKEEAVAWCHEVLSQGKEGDEEATYTELQLVEHAQGMRGHVTRQCGLYDTELDYVILTSEV